MALNTLGTNRDQLIDLAIAERERLINHEVLVGDPRRWRPRWFDGRFLAASDLQGEQNYFLVRQADLGRAGGSGVIDGLMVSEVVDAGTGGERLRIEPGQGVTDTGELVVLFDPLNVNPADVPEIQRIDAAFGLQVIPNEPGRTRTGLYILALRPVEWTANPIGAYPTSLTGTRKVEDSTIVEGVAVSLIPFADQGSDESWNRRRARVAREIFVDGRDQGLTSGVLPLAMVALRGNFIEWVDPFLVRRETGAERPAGMDFGFGAAIAPRGAPAAIPASSGRHHERDQRSGLPRHELSRCAAARRAVPIGDARRRSSDAALLSTRDRRRAVVHPRGRARRP